MLKQCCSGPDTQTEPRTNPWTSALSRTPGPNLARLNPWKESQEPNPEYTCPLLMRVGSEISKKTDKKFSENSGGWFENKRFAQQVCFGLDPETQPLGRL